MGKIIKGVALYTLVLIGILVLIAAFIFGLMFFIPSFTPFGWGAINISEKHEDWSENLSMKLQDGHVPYDNGTDSLYNKKMYDIEIDAGEFNVEIAPNEALNGSSTQDAFLRMRTVRHVFGLVEGSKDINVVTKMEMYQQLSSGEISYKFKIKVVHPTKGAIAYKDSSLYIEVPTDACFNISVKTTGGDIKIGNIAEKVTTDAGLFESGFDASLAEKGVKINDLTVQTKSGSCEFIPLGAVASAIDKNRAPLETKVQFSSLTLKTDGGKFNFSNIKNLRVGNTSNLGVLLVDVNKGDISFNNVNAAMVVLGDDVSITANKINTEGNPFSYRAKKGFFHIGEIVTTGTQLITIVTNNANIQIDTITSNAAMINTTYGDIVIGTMNGQLKSTTTHGKISVNVAEDTISASSTYGDIYVGTYKKNASFSNGSGSITANFLVSAANEHNRTKAQSKSGSVKLTNQVNNLELIGTDSATFTVVFNKLYFGDAFASDGPFTAANHKIIMKGSSSANLSVPLAEFPIKLVLNGTTDEEKKQNHVTSNLITGESVITKDEVIAGRLSGDPCVIDITSKGSGNVSINSYNKDQELIASTNSWFDIYAYDNSETPKPLFPINYYYEEAYRHEYSTSDNEDLNFRWNKVTLSNGMVVAVAKATVTIKNINVSSIPNEVTLVFKSKKYACGTFVKCEGDNEYSGSYKEQSGYFVPLDEEDINNINAWNRLSDSQKKKETELKAKLPTTYKFVEGNSQLYKVQDSAVTFYVMADFDGTASYCKVVLTMTKPESK